MTERTHDMPYTAAVNDTELPPSAEWFSRQGGHFLGAQAVIQRIGVFPEDIRSYKEAIAEDDPDERIMCDMALDVIKLSRAGTRFSKYGIDTDLYIQSVKKRATAMLGERAATSFRRSRIQLDNHIIDK